MIYSIHLYHVGLTDPYHKIYQKRAGYYGPREVAPLGGTVEILSGNLCGKASLGLSRCPDGYQVGDIVRVFLGEKRIYLGETTNEPWQYKGTLECVSLAERILKAAWRSTVAADGTSVEQLQADFLPYLRTVLERAVLPDVVTIGDIPDVPVTLAARTLFELVGDTMQAALPALVNDGTCGVTPDGEFVVRARTKTVTHKFWEWADTPPGQRQDYANCIRFIYKLPSGAEAAYEYRSARAGEGEAWMVETLPASVVTTSSGASVAPVGVQLEIGHSTLTTPFGLSQAASFPIFDTQWSGKLGDGVGGAEKPVVTGTGLYDFAGKHFYRTATAGAELVKVMAGDLRRVIRAQPGSVYAGAVNYTDFTTTPLRTPLMQYSPDQGVTWAFYPPDMNIYLNPGQQVWFRYDPATFVPDQFVGGIAVSQEDTSVAAPVTEYPVHIFGFGDARVTMPLTTYGMAAGGFGNYPDPAGFIILAATVELGSLKTVLMGDVITTDSSVVSVTGLNRVTGASVALTGGTSGEGGRRTWVVPADAQIDGLRLTGNLREVGWIGGSFTDLPVLQVYALNLLRRRQYPVRSWAGRYKNLRVLDVSGVARFEGHWRGPQDVPVTRGQYDLTTGQCFIEAGTYQAINDTEALAAAFENVGRAIRTVSHTGGTA